MCLFSNGQLWYDRAQRRQIICGLCRSFGGIVGRPIAMASDHASWYGRRKELLISPVHNSFVLAFKRSAVLITFSSADRAAIYSSTLFILLQLMKGGCRNMEPLVLLRTEPANRQLLLCCLANISKVHVIGRAPTTSKVQLFSKVFQILVSRLPPPRRKKYLSFSVLEIDLTSSMTR